MLLISNLIAIITFSIMLPDSCVDQYELAQSLTILVNYVKETN